MCWVVFRVSDPEVSTHPPPFDSALSLKFECNSQVQRMRQSGAQKSQEGTHQWQRETAGNRLKQQQYNLLWLLVLLWRSRCLQENQLDRNGQAGLTCCQEAWMQASTLREKLCMNGIFSRHSIKPVSSLAVDWESSQDDQYIVHLG